MSPRPVLIVHADPRRRSEARALMGNREVLEVDCRARAIPLLSGGPLGLVLSQVPEFRRLLRDLERHTPGTPRAVLCPDDPETMAQLSALASEGYDFSTIHEHSLHQLKALIEPRGSARVVPASPLLARFVAAGTAFFADVAEVGNDGLGLMLSAGAPVELLTPGLRLEQATVTDSTGQVLDPRTWVVRTLRNGGGFVHLGVSIEPQIRGTEGRAPGRLHDEVRIRGLLLRAMHRGAPFNVRLSDDSRQREYSGCSLDAAGRLVLVNPRPGSELHAGEIALVSFELQGSQVEGATAILEASPERLVLAQPRSALRRDRRDALRVRLPDASPCLLTFRSELTGEVLAPRVIDLQPLGVSFEFDGTRETLPPGLRLPEVNLELWGRKARCAAVVQTSRALNQDVTRQRVGLRLQPFTEADRQIVIDAWLGVLVPEVSCGANFDFPKVWQLFEHEEVRFPDYPLGAAQTVSVLGAGHRAIGDGRHGLGKSFVFNEGGAVLGHMSGLRTHSRTWFVQHLVVKSGYHRQTHVAQTIVNLTFDYADAMGDVEYLLGFWRASNRWPSRVFGAVTSKLLRPGLAHLTSMNPMRRLVGPLPVPPSLKTRAATEGDLQALVELLRATADPVFLKGHDLVEGELNFETLGARYRAAGLRRSRVVGVVTRAGRPVGWTMLERMTPGLFWAEWYNGFRLFLAEPGAPDADQVREALVAWTMVALANEGTPIAECLASEGDLPCLTRLGFSDLGRVMEYTAHRSLTRDFTAQMVAVFEKLNARGRGRADPEGETA